METKDGNGAARLSPQDLRDAARKVDEIKRLDEDGHGLHERFTEPGALGSLGERARTALGPTHVSGIGSDVLGTLIVNAVLGHMSDVRAAQVARIAFLVDVEECPWPPTIQSARPVND